MQIDIEYLKRLLLSFENADKAFTNLIELEKQGFDIDSEDFIFISD